MAAPRPLEIARDDPAIGRQLLEANGAGTRHGAGGRKTARTAEYPHDPIALAGCKVGFDPLARPEEGRAERAGARPDAASASLRRGGTVPSSAGGSVSGEEEKGESQEKGSGCRRDRCSHGGSIATPPLVHNLRTTYTGDMGTLYLVATPIGNLGDISLRALETLKHVDAIACEDTRHTIKLLSYYEIRKPLLSCHANDEERGAARVLELLVEGKAVAYCSDAGTPGLSDPGALLARKAREAGHAVTALPGASAFAVLVSASGFGGRSFLFDGFPSPKQGKRKSRVVELMARQESFVLYESPHRIAKLLAEIAAVDPTRRVCIGREMTKLHEEFIVGTAAEALERLSSAGEPRGEFAVLVGGAELA